MVLKKNLCKCKMMAKKGGKRPQKVNQKKSKLVLFKQLIFNLLNNQSIIIKILAGILIKSLRCMLFF